MELNSDFSQRVLVHAGEIPWQASPMPGVERRMLDRIGGEVARATTIVRFAENSNFSAHTHNGGEEYIVLEGVFQDEDGDFPTGSYVRNPPTSSHTPRSDSGCTIFVKLWQFDPEDRTQLKVNLKTANPTQVEDRKGVSVLPLFQDDKETVRFETWEAGTDVCLDLPDGGEFLVLSGGFTESGEMLVKHSWLRLPVGSMLDATDVAPETKVWIKLGHLPYAAAPAV